MTEIEIKPNKGEIVIYTSPDGTANIDVRFEAETLWLSQKMMAELFDKDSDTIGLHLKNIYAEQELEENATTVFFSVVQKEGKIVMSRLSSTQVCKIRYNRI
jgi:hypothetical protein